MLSNRLNIEMSDPEIRGGIDGFVLGSTLTQTLGSLSTLKLSQLLDMYYTPRVSINFINKEHKRLLNSFRGQKIYHIFRTEFSMM